MLTCWHARPGSNLECVIQEFQGILFTFNQEQQIVVISVSPWRLTADEKSERQEE